MLLKLLVTGLTFMLTLNPDCNDRDIRDQVADPSGQLVTKIITDQLEHPWELVWGPDNHIWFTERDGRLSRIDPATEKLETLMAFDDVVSRGEGGMLGLALHPDFAREPYVYIAYNYRRDGDYREKVMRYRVDNNRLSEPKVIIENINAASIHNGCRLAISPDKKLFITTGDAANQSDPQRLNSVNGKVLRFNLDGSIPADNPQPSSPVWSYGHRNAQGIVFANNRLYSSEHGPSSDDEINIIEKGRNYGWPTVMGPCNENAEKDFCNSNQVKEPIFDWSPTLAVCGLDYYDNDRIGLWKNSLLLCTLKAGRLVQLRLDPSGERIAEEKSFLQNQFGRLRDICISPDGKVYVCSSNGRNDKIIEISIAP